MREILRAIREAILLSQRVETLGEQISSVSRTSRQEIGFLRQDVSQLRDRVTRLETYIEIAQTLSAPASSGPKLEKD